MNVVSRPMRLGRILIACVSISLLSAVVVGRASGAPPVAGQHDMLLLLPDGPVHLRVMIKDGDQSLQQRRQEYIQRLVVALDTDKDGKVSRMETTKHPLFSTSRRFEGNPFLNRLQARKPYSIRDLEMQVSRTAGQFVSYRQNNQLADQDLSVFRVLDSDESGLIDRVEMRLAASRIAERDTDFDQCVTFDEFTDAPEQDPMMVVTLPTASQAPATLHSDLLRDAREPILAARLVKRYDEDRDASLSAEELGWAKDRLSKLDTDGDEKLKMQELSVLSTGTPDLTLAVDMQKDASDAMRIVGVKAVDIDVSRADLVRLKREGLSLSVGYRHRDPLSEAKTNAQDTFNTIDVDSNGYLDRDEIENHQRFQRYLFDAMDKDEDDRVFAEEMLSYVREYTEPAATSCQITLMDTGNGFFQMLDQSGDGRISIRELRDCEQALLKVSGNEPAINPSTMTKSYRIEIQRGGVSLFGRVNRPSAETPAALLKPPSGPMWFQRMDRNGDGDLTWDEFLGPRDVFHQIDADGDDLIDESEAKKVTTKEA